MAVDGADGADGAAATGVAGPGVVVAKESVFGGEQGAGRCRLLTDGGERADASSSPTTASTSSKERCPVDLGQEGAAQRYYQVGYQLAAAKRPARTGTRSTSTPASSPQPRRSWWTAGTYESEPKTDGSANTIALDSMTISELRDHKARQEKERTQWGTTWRDTGKVFTKEHGSWLHPETVSETFRRILATTDLPHHPAGPTPRRRDAHARRRRRHPRGEGNAAALHHHAVLGHVHESVS
nr:hypothetical protein [Streptomyces tailanensis]